MNLNKKIKISLLICITFFSNFSLSFDKKLPKAPITVTQGNSYKFQSEVLAEERKLSIRLPVSYKSTKKDYPVLYLTDGENHFGHAVSAVSILEEHGMIPESIVIAIPNLEGKRLRDLVYESDNFIRFIKDELKPFVNANFRTNNVDILFGHSSAGGFTLNMLRNHTNLFSHYVSASPSISMKKERIQQYKDFLKSRDKKKTISLYIAMGGKADEGVAIKPENIEYLLTLLKENAPESISWNYDYHPEQNHMTSPYLALFRGLSWVFKGYQSPTFIGYQDFQEFGGMRGLKVHFKKRHQDYQTPKEIPEDVLVGLGFTFINEKSYSEAIKILNSALKLYPESYGAYNALGTLFMKQDKRVKALSAFEKALTLAKKNSSPHLSYFEKQVERAKNKLAKI